ncbi:MAG: hypothetical protein HYZ21_14740 [Chloroflexi bacterium]|nr:hypothetical protein [Chloroflexota bacterium]
MSDNVKFVSLANAYLPDQPRVKFTRRWMWLFVSLWGRSMPVAGWVS